MALNDCLEQVDTDLADLTKPCHNCAKMFKEDEYLFKFDYDVYSCFDYRNSPVDQTHLFECLECRMMTLDFQSRVQRVLPLRFSPSSTRSDLTKYVKQQNNAVIIGNLKSNPCHSNKKIYFRIQFDLREKESHQIKKSQCQKLELRLSNIWSKDAVSAHQPWTLPCKLYLNNRNVWQCKKNDPKSHLNRFDLTNGFTAKSFQNGGHTLILEVNLNDMPADDSLVFGMTLVRVEDLSILEDQIQKKSRILF